MRLLDGGKWAFHQFHLGSCLHPHIQHILCHNQLFFALATSWSQRWFSVWYRTSAELFHQDKMRWKCLKGECVCVCVCLSACVHTCVSMWVLGGSPWLHHRWHSTVESRLFQATYQHISLQQLPWIVKVRPWILVWSAPKATPISTPIDCCEPF